MIKLIKPGPDLKSKKALKSASSFSIKNKLKKRAGRQAGLANVGLEYLQEMLTTWLLYSPCSSWCVTALSTLRVLFKLYSALLTGDLASSTTTGPCLSLDCLCALLSCSWPAGTMLYLLWEWLESSTNTLSTEGQYLISF